MLGAERRAAATGPHGRGHSHDDGGAADAGRAARERRALAADVTPGRNDGATQRERRRRRADFIPTLTLGL